MGGGREDEEDEEDEEGEGKRVQVTMSSFEIEILRRIPSEHDVGECVHCKIASSSNSHIKEINKKNKINK